MAVSKKKTEEKPAEIKVAVVTSDGKKKSDLTVKPKDSYLRNRNHLIHEAAVMYLANRRSGTASTQSRGEVNKSTKKPWKQKGTGNARAGRASSPLWIGGGVAHGPRPRDYSYQIPKKMKKLSLYSSMARKLRDNEVVVVDQIKLDVPKTKGAAELLEKLNVKSSALLVTKNNDSVLTRAIRNIPKVATTTVGDLNTLDVLKYKKLVLTQEVFEEISALLEGGKK